MKDTNRDESTAQLVAGRETHWNRMALALGAVCILAIASAFVTFASGQSGENPAPVFVKEIPS